MSVSTTMKFLRALMIMVVLSQAELRRLGDWQSRIMYGQRVDIEDYPYMVRLDIGNPPLARCSGALITTQTVLTAAHCVLDSDWRLQNINVYIEVTGETIPASSMIPHEAYNPQLNPHDIAVIYLESPSTYSYGLPVLNYQEHLPALGSIIEIIGYGVTETKNAPDYLSGAKTQIIEPANTLGIPNGFFVYNEAGAGACQGDSGSPAIIRNGPEHIIVGVEVAVTGEIYSTGKCENKKQLYISVSAYYDWIMNRIR